MKYKKTIMTFLIIFFLIISLFYLFLLLNWEKVQALLTFPWIWINVQDLVWYVETDLVFDEINLSDSNWNNINWLYVSAWEWAKTVYYFHWNWWPLNYFYSEIKYINSLWYNVMAYDYPWYWKSSWFPYKKTVDEFSDVFYKYIKSEKNIKDEDLILWWYSVWTAVATDFASKNNFDKLVLISPFSSRYDMSRKMFWFPIQKFLFMADSYITKDLVKNIEKQVLIIHWNNDKIIPFFQWKEVFQNYKWNKNFIEIDNFWHNWIIDIYWDSLKSFFIDFLSNKWLDFKDNYLLFNFEEKEKLEKQNYINSLDLETDSSITKFVNSSVSFKDKKYIPKNLVNIYSDYVHDTKWNSQFIRAEANEALQKLAKSFYKEFQKKITVVSAYRSYDYQKWIKDRGCPNNLCAKAWFSEHQSGLAVDFFEVTTQKEFLSKPNLNKYFEWLNTNAHKYWFINTYMKWLEIDGYDIEPWHWRYVWEQFATYLKENNITIAEFYKNRNNNLNLIK